MKTPTITLILLTLGGITAGASAGLATGGSPTAEPTWQVDAAFPGGNIILDKIEGNTAFVRQDLRDTSGKWFYFHFRVRGAAGRTLTFHFTDGYILSARGPAVSPDGGKTWAWLGDDNVKVAPPQAPWPEKTAEFSYTFPAAAADVRFSSGIPYVESHLKQFLAKHTADPALKVESLCSSQKGRDTELLRVGRLDGEPDYRVLLTARHHACEAVANYVMEGILETALSSGEDGEWFRRHVEIMAVPFMDKDGVEDGDQGKNRKPHDHNRDYIQEIYPTVKALKAKAPVWSQGKLKVAIDLHCPWIRGDNHKVIFMAGGPAACVSFARTLEAIHEGLFRFHFTDAGAQEEETRPRPIVGADASGLQDPGASASQAPARRGMRGSFMSCMGWTSTLPGIRLASTIETPYANASRGEMTEQAARAWGQDIARAIRAFLEKP